MAINDLEANIRKDLSIIEKCRWYLNKNDRTKETFRGKGFRKRMNEFERKFKDLLDQLDDIDFTTDPLNTTKSNIEEISKACKAVSRQTKNTIKLIYDTPMKTKAKSKTAGGPYTLHIFFSGGTGSTVILISFIFNQKMKFIFCRIKTISFLKNKIFFFISCH